MERPFEFDKKFFEVHKPGRIKRDKIGNFAGAVVTEEWKIGTVSDAGIVLQNVVKDLQDYFAVSMEMKLELTTACGPAEKMIFIGVDVSLPERTFRVDAKKDGIAVFGTDEKYAAQGSYFLEDEMNLKEVPVIECGSRTKTMRFSPRMQYSGMHDSSYPDEHLLQIVHAGMDTIGVGVGRDLDNMEQIAKVNELIDRAEQYGISAYTFSSFKNEMHPDDPGAFEYYDAKYGKLFDLCPKIKGFIVVGEACEFPSHDPRTTGKSWRESKDGDIPSPGWFPCSDYPQFLSMLKAVIDKHAKGVDFVFWTYNWGYEKLELREAMLRTMPTDITMMATFEMFEEIQVTPEFKEYTVDYTLWKTGPSYYFETESKIAKERGIRMISMTGTSGCSWDIGTVPYLPAPQRWIERWQAVADAQDNWRLDGIREAHSWGLWPNFLTEMEKYAFMTPATDMNALLRRIVERDFGAENADEMIEVFDLFSEGMAHCVSTNEDQYGPARVGPAYPLFFKEWELIPVGPESRVAPNFEAYPVYTYNLDNTARLQYETDEYMTMARLFDEGIRRMTTIVANMTGRDGEEAEKMLGVAKYIANTARTIYHVKRWHFLKGKLGIYVDGKATWVGGRKGIEDAKKAVKPLVPAKNPRPIVLELIEILKAEIANAEATIPLVEADSRLGFNQEIDYASSAEQLRWKIAWAEKTMKEELLPLLD